MLAPMRPPATGQIQGLKVFEKITVAFVRSSMNGNRRPGTSLKRAEPCAVGGDVTILNRPISLAFSIQHSNDVLYSTGAFLTRKMELHFVEPDRPSGRQQFV